MRRFEFALDNGTVLHIQPPTVKMYYKGYLAAKNDPQLFRSIAEICSRNDEGLTIDESCIEDNFTTDDLGRFMEEFPKWIKGVRDSDPN